ncbi:MAG: OmpA family protein [Thiohalobacteraceae bacterium]
MNKTLLVTAIAASLSASGLAIAHEGGTVNEAFVGDSRAHIVTDGSGNCVRTSSWSDDKLIEGCGLVVAEPEPAAEPAPVPAPKPISETVSLSAAALFDFDKDKIKEAAKPRLDEVANRVRSLGDVEAVTIVGHTDSVGSEAYNEQLSMRRANAVKNYLLDQGVDPSLVSTSGMGESQPVADNSTDAGRAQNRRVEITIRGSEQVVR